VSVKITYADIAKGKGISTGAPAVAKKDPAGEDASAFGSVGAKKTQAQMGDAVSGKGEGEV
jgi:hypothetical protein